MSLDQLTKKAKNLLDTVVNSGELEGNKIKAGNLLKHIKKSSGLGSILVNNFSPLDLQRQKTIDLDRLVKEAYYQSLKMEHFYVGTEHLFLALLKISGSKRINQVKEYLNEVNVFPKAMNLLAEDNENIILNSFGNNLTKEHLYNSEEPLVFRPELDNIISTLLKKDNSNPLLVGDLGVGKKSMINLLIRNICSLDVPSALSGYHVIELDLMGYILSKGNLETGLVSLKEEMMGLKRTIIYLKNFQNIFIPTNSGIGIPVIFPLFKDLLDIQNVKYIAVLDESIYEKIVSDNEHILENFSVIGIHEPEEDISKKILKLKADILGSFHNVKVNKSALDHIFELSKSKSIPGNYPKKVVDILDISCASILVKNSMVPEEYKTLVDTTIDLYNKIDSQLSKGEYDKARLSQKTLTKIDKKLLMYEESMVDGKTLKLSKADVDTALKDLSISTRSSNSSSTSSLSSLSKKLKSQIIGQDKAIEVTVKALIRARLGLRSKNQPVGNFLFLGPTGVGKTELAKCLAKEAFSGDDGKHLIRLDMSDFSEKHTVARLVGSPPGYIGFNEGGDLTSQIEENPDSVVLFDEIEKAHPDVLNILLQIMEEGELADAKGTVFDFSQAIIVLTSNLGTEILHNAEIGFRSGAELIKDKFVEDQLKNNLKKILKPELLNRFDEVVVFRQLNVKDQEKILDLLLKNVLSTLEQQDVNLKVYKTAKKTLLKKGYSKEYGARSLRRIIEKELLDAVAEVLLKNTSRPLNLTAKSKDDQIIIA